MRFRSHWQNVLTAVINEEEIDPAGGILHHEEDIDIMPGNIELSALEVVMGNVMSRETDPEGLYRYDERKIRLHFN